MHAGNVAMQNLNLRDWAPRVVGSENCLYLNVYTRTLERNKRPVMFFVHGGGFVEGSANDYLYNQDYFMTTDVVLVSVNFRLGAMGKTRACLTRCTEKLYFLLLVPLKY